jgi:diaminohydroxyphosphoribosylaminopyrimidine deaminase/5-amino-6-(5-phosphoribosylamino)uracil reductase
MGGAAKSMFAMPEFTHMNQAIALDIIDMRQIGVDIRLRAKPRFGN